MKKVLCMMLVLGIILTGVGCKKSNDKDAEATVTNFLDALKKGDFVKAKNYVGDTEGFAVEEEDELVSAMFNKIKYEVMSVEGKDDVFTVKIKLKHPNFAQVAQVMQAQSASLLESALSNLSDTDVTVDPDEIAKQINEAMDKAMEDDESITETISEVIIEKIDGKYKISPGFTIATMFGM